VNAGISDCPRVRMNAEISETIQATILGLGMLTILGLGMQILGLGMQILEID